MNELRGMESFALNVTKPTRCVEMMTKEKGGEEDEEDRQALGSITVPVYKHREVPTLSHALETNVVYAYTVKKRDNCLNKV